MLLNEEDTEDIGWRLLERFITKYEKDKETVLHKSAVLKLLEMGVFLPSWLISSYIVSLEVFQVIIISVCEQNIYIH